MRSGRDLAGDDKVPGRDRAVNEACGSRKSAPRPQRALRPQKSDAASAGGKTATCEIFPENGPNRGENFAFWPYINQGDGHYMEFWIR